MSNAGEKNSSYEVIGNNVVSETLLQTLFDEAPFGVYLVDSEFCIRAVNPIARSVFGNTLLNSPTVSIAIATPT